MFCNEKSSDKFQNGFAELVLEIFFDSHSGVHCIEFLAEIYVITFPATQLSTHLKPRVL